MGDERVKRMPVIVLVVCLALFVLSSCGYSQDDLDRARAESYEEGLAAGYQSGYEDGFSEGKSDGYSEGKSDGYTDGYTAGLAAAPPVSRSAPAEEEDRGPVSVDYVLNTNSRKFHYPDCSSVADMAGKNRQDFSGTREEVIAMGYVPCKRCNP